MPKYGNPAVHCPKCGTVKVSTDSTVKLKGTKCTTPGCKGTMKEDKKK